MAAWWLNLLFCFLVGLSGLEAKKGHAVPTYFKRLNPDGTLVDASDARTRLNFTSPIREMFAPTAVLKVSPDFVEDGGVVNVSWSGIPRPNKSDVIAIYCPSDDQANHYLDVFNVNEASTYSSGFGWHEVTVYNLRTICEFRYYQKKSILLATSNLLEFKGGIYAPSQGHIALTGEPTEMRVMWVSGTDEMPIVWYGEDASVPLVAKGMTKTYKASSMCGPPATSNGFWDPGFIHDVLLTNLTPSTQYFYAYGSAKMRTSVRQFRSAPRINPDVSFKFIAYGDMGLSGIPGAFDIAKFMSEEAANGTSLIFHVGDISYARGYAYIWDQWHLLIEPFATVMPYMVGMGNHEQDHTTGGSKDPSGAPGEGWHPWWGNYGDDSGGECGVPMYIRFHMPDNGNALWWYSFDYGSVHFVMISTEHNFTEGSRQYVWLANDLKNVDRAKTPWVVLGGHRPMYSSQKVSSDYSVSLAMQQSFEHLLYRYKVDLAFWGHYHSYERTCPVYRHECQDEGLGTTHIVVGSAGAALDLENYWPMSWSRYHENDYGYARILVANKSALHLEWVRNRDNVVRDQVWLIKPKGDDRNSPVEV